MNRKKAIIISASISILALLLIWAASVLAWTADFLTNGDFTSGTGSWTDDSIGGADLTYIGSYDGHSGLASMEGTYPGGYPAFYQDVLLSSGTYSVTALAVKAGGAGDWDMFTISVLDHDHGDTTIASSGIIGANFMPEGQWNGLETDFVLTETITVRLQIGGSDQNVTYVDYVHLSGEESEPTVTPEPSAIPTATQQSVANLPCISNNATMTTPVATSTPTPPYSFTPQPTRTPGGPTPTPHVVSHPLAASFDNYISPFVVLDNRNKWLRAPAHITDGTGVAFTPWFTGSGADFAYGLLMPIRIQAPFRITGWAYSAASLWQGSQAAIRIWGVTSGTVTLLSSDANMRVGNLWNPFDLSVSGSAIYDDILISAYYTGTVTLPAIDSIANDYGARLDDITIYIGQEAMLTSYPLCSPGGPTTHGCAVTTVTVDVFAARCPAPIDMLDLGGWIQYAVCRINVYFALLPENGAQIAGIIYSANELEPFGSFVETKFILDFIWQRVSVYYLQYAIHQANVLDWSKFFNWQAALNPQLPIPVSFTTTEYYNCTILELDDLPESVRRPACMSVEYIQRSGLAAPINLLIAVFAIYGMVEYFRTTWMTVN